MIPMKHNAPIFFGRPTTFRTKRKLDFDTFCYIVNGEVRHIEGENYCVIPMTKCLKYPEIPDMGGTAECVLELYHQSNTSLGPIASQIASNYQLSSGKIECNYGTYEVEIRVGGHTGKGHHFDILVRDNATNRIWEGRILPNRKNRIKKILGMA